MQLLQKAIETYDKMSHLAGVETAGQKVPLAPVGHDLRNVDIEITLDKNGDYIQASKKEGKIIIPVTEKSAGRTGTGIFPHPLCDQLCYVALAGKTNNEKDKHKKYIDQLRAWSVSKYSHPKIAAVYNYIVRETILDDLEKAGLIERDENGNLKDEYKKKTVCWTILGLGEKSGPVWTDRELHKIFADYYINCISEAPMVVCILDGRLHKAALQHPKGILSRYSSAKIISSNDTSNYTYLGMFTSANETLSIGYESSQKAHNVLKWIAGNNSVSCGTREYICWSPDGIKTDMPGIFDTLIGDKSEDVTPTNYKDKLRKIIYGYKSVFPDNQSIVIGGFDAASKKSGRLAVVCDEELNGSEFLEKMKHWDETCCWYDNRRGVTSPPINKIVRYAYGIKKGEGDSATIKTDENQKIVGQASQALLECKIDQGLFPRLIMCAISERANKIKNLPGKIRDDYLLTTCAVIRKYYIDHFGEEYGMTLDINCNDRSYQYGRLLAVMEKIEKDTYDENENKKHEAYVIRNQQNYVINPGRATKEAIEWLKISYYPKLSQGKRVYYEKIIGEIMEKISEHGLEEYNDKLEETYILGYYAEKNDLYKKKEECEASRL